MSQNPKSPAHESARSAARPAADHIPYLAEIRRILQQALGECEVYFFGSRAVDRPAPTSDIDVAVLTPREMAAEMSRAREMLEAARIPFSVDLVDLRATAPAFARNVRRQGAAMETSKDRLQSFQRVVATLDEILQMPASVVVRDAAIQRFEYTFESLWKLLKAHLREYEGVVCNSPKGCFREALKAKLLSASDTDLCLAMTDDRNLTSHTYLEPLAEAIYKKLPPYLAVMQRLQAALEEQIGADPAAG